MKSRMLSAVGAVLAVALCGGAAQGVTAPSGDRYVALGSSYAAGPGLEPVEDGPCARSGQNYAHRVAAAAGLDLVDASCSGATTADVLNRSQTVAGTLMPPQIGAVTSYTRLVTVTVGGNDLNLVGSMLAGSGCELLAGGVSGLCDRVTRTAPATPDDFAAVAPAQAHGWRVPSLVVAGTALAVVPLVLLFIRDFPSDVGARAYGAEPGSA
ncbi:GDSL-type esterase/lipase family protein, partial [Nocardia wallacei]|uniref:GDSL-type esterase/lipase family protein n=1 Tax=Nocardia wallacei TaxID=480035 RepID=UPI002455EE14